MHPACADNERRRGTEAKDEGGEVCIVLFARQIGVFGVLLLVGDEVVVAGGDGGLGGAFESVGGFAAAEQRQRMRQWRGYVLVYFDMTCVIRALGSLPDAHASMRACRFEPLPEMSTTRLYCESAIVEGEQFME